MNYFKPGSIIRIGSSKPKCPNDLYNALKAWRPMYVDERGNLFVAQFENVTFWRHTNEWAAYYCAIVKGHKGIQTEKFVWTMRGSQYAEIVQIKPKGTPWRVFRG